MNDTSKRLVLSCIAIAIVACLCLSVLSIAGALFLLISESEYLEDFNFRETSPQIELTQAEIDEQMDEIQQQVIEIRGLRPNQAVQRSLLTPEELRQRVIDDFLKDYTPQDAEQDAIVLAAFGLLEADYDLQNLLLELYSEQIAGFYDHETKEMYVVKDRDFLGPERLTYAHEYTHALQDQNFDIEDGLNYNNEACKEDSERCAAIQALLEGDASIIELNWFTSYATRSDQQQIVEFYRNFQSPVFESAPAFMKEDFLFPYQAGQEFVQHLIDIGGWESVNQAYLDPPVSTSQILHPEYYPGIRPVPVFITDLGDTLGIGWDMLDEGVLGEWYTYLVLAFGWEPNSRLDTGEASDAAEGWSGDKYQVFYNRQFDSTVMVLKTEWESRNEASEFGQAFSSYANKRFGEHTETQTGIFIWEAGQLQTWFIAQGVETIWILAPDRQTAQEVWEVLSEP